MEPITHSLTYLLAALQAAAKESKAAGSKLKAALAVEDRAATKAAAKVAQEKAAGERTPPPTLSLARNLSMSLSLTPSRAGEGGRGVSCGGSGQGNSSQGLSLIHISEPTRPY